MRGQSRFEPLRGPCGNGEPHAVRDRSGERQPRVDLEEVEVRRDAHRHVAGVGDLDGDQPDRLGGLASGDDHRPWRVVARAGGGTERVAHHHHPRAVGEHGLHLHLAHDVGDARQHVGRGEHAGTARRCLHQAHSVASGFAHRVGDERGGLRHVELQASRAAGTSQLGGGEDEQPVAIGRREAHVGEAIRSRPRGPRGTARPCGRRARRRVAPTRTSSPSSAARPAT